MYINGQKISEYTIFLVDGLVGKSILLAKWSWKVLSPLKPSPKNSFWLATFADRLQLFYISKQNDFHHL